MLIIAAFTTACSLFGVLALVYWMVDAACVQARIRIASQFCPVFDAFGLLHCKNGGCKQYDF